VSEHVVLLGDSIFDNSSYTKGLPDVVTHLRGMLPDGAVASLLAVDGSATGDLADQLTNLPPDVTRAVVSVGGNDALLNADLLNLPVSSTQQALLVFGRARRSSRKTIEPRSWVSRVVYAASPSAPSTMATFPMIRRPRRASR
jgi:hypothetical protein